MKNTVALLGLGLLLAAPATAEDISWNLDKNHSAVGFSVRHLGISNVRGEFKDFDATIKGDAKTGQLSSVEATTQTASIDTGNSSRDKHLASDDFFAADKNPTISFKTRKITWDTPKTFIATVDLTMRGVTKKVVAKGELLGTHKVDFGDGPQLRAGYEVTATVNRKDFGLKFDKMAEGVSVVGDEVKIDISVETSHKL